MDASQRAYRYRLLMNSHVGYRTSSDAPSCYIRVMTLFPGRFGSPISCELKRVMITSSDWNVQPPYEALSWAWGDLRDKEEIKIGNTTLKIPANLEPALQHIRYEKHPRQLWIDAVCIDQSDLQERSEQVQNMDRIYWSARRVLIWLGVSDSYSEMAFDTIQSTRDISLENARKFCEATSDDYNRAEEWSYLTYQSQAQIHPTAVSQGTMDFARKFGVKRLFRLSITEFHALWMTFSNRPWWTRLWVLQELILGLQPLLICGHRYLHFDDVAKFVGMVLLVLHDTWRCRSVGAFMENFLSYWRSRFNLTMSQRRFTWKDFFIVRELQNNECSDPRDRIFAILSLIPFRTAYFEPSYLLEANQVFTDAARAVIEETEDLHVICLASDIVPDSTTDSSTSGSTFCRLPTWAPDWAPYQGNRNAVNQPGGNCPFNADNSTALNVYECLSHSRNPRVLTLRGIFCDTIDSIYKNSPAQIQLLHSRLSQRLYHTKESSVDVLLRTLLFDCTARTLVYVNRLSVDSAEYETYRSSFYYYYRTLPSYRLPVEPKVKQHRNEMEATLESETTSRPKEGHPSLDDIDGSANPLSLAPLASYHLSPQSQIAKLSSFSADNEVPPSVLPPPPPRRPPKSTDPLHPETPCSVPPTPPRSSPDPSIPAYDPPPQSRVEWNKELQGQWDLFITRKGYIGRASRKARAGDSIFIAYGSKVPFVVRPCARVGDNMNSVGETGNERGATGGERLKVVHFEFVSAAYVHGIMDGEVVKRVERKKTKGKGCELEQIIYLV